jgi:hypothetical protein
LSEFVKERGCDHHPDCSFSALHLKEGDQLLEFFELGWVAFRVRGATERLGPGTCTESLRLNF